MAALTATGGARWPKLLRAEAAKAAEDLFVVLPAGLLLVASVYRLCATVSDVRVGFQLKDAMRRQAWAVTEDCLRSPC